jgi:hypothetical protein
VIIVTSVYYKNLKISQVWWHMSIRILALRRLRQDDHEFKASLSYIVIFFHNKEINE